jgi:hypothetical protein
VNCKALHLPVEVACARPTAGERQYVMPPRTEARGGTDEAAALVFGADRVSVSMLATRSNGPFCLEAFA